MQHIPIILASQSSARKALLRQAGIRFRAVPANIRERVLKGRPYQETVIFNALKKAQCVARRYRQGIIIGADTIVVVNKHIVGKPRTFREAQRILRELCRAPQWVYTGIAVINAQTGRVATGYEKTKVYLCPLSDDDIALYLAKVPYADKAGGFDIQSRGSIFVRRIEGCFNNVVGLPMSKLAVLLEKVGYKLF